MGPQSAIPANNTSCPRFRKELASFSATFIGLMMGSTRQTIFDMVLPWWQPWLPVAFPLCSLRGTHFRAAARMDGYLQATLCQEIWPRRKVRGYDTQRFQAVALRNDHQYELHNES